MSDLHATKSPMGERRTTLCASCGSVLAAGALADRANCSRCDLDTALPPRLARPRAPRVFPQDHALRGGVTQTLAVPPELLPLWEGERSIPSHREAEAFGVFMDLRTKLLAGEKERELALVVLARELSIRMLLHGEAERARATLECTLDAVTTPFARACVLGALVRGCLRTGDVDAASSWMRVFDPTPSTLLEDTELRISSAAIAAASSDDATVLAWLGANESEVTSHVMLAWLVSLLRARSLERTSRPGEARAELEDLLIRRPTALEAIDHNLPRLVYLGAVPAWSDVRRRFLERTRPVGELHAEGRVVIAIAVLLLGGMALFAYYQHATRDHLLFAVALAITLPTVYTGTRLIVLGRRLHHAFVYGRAAPAVVSGIKPGLYGRGRHHRLTKVGLEVTLDDGTTKVHADDYRFLDPRDQARYRPGAEVTVFVEPERPGYAVITIPPP